MEVMLDNLKNVEESNHFLRALWANIRAHFGRCSWQFSPYRESEKKTIYLGFMSYKKQQTLEVKLRYKKKGNLVAISFNNTSDVEHSIDDLPVIKKLVKKSLKYKEQIKLFYFSTYFEVIRGNVSAYSRENFQLTPIEDNRAELSIQVEGYDEVDAKSLAQHKSKIVSEILSVFTNYFFVVSEPRQLVSPVEKVSNNQYSSDVNWIDDKPRNGSYVQLSKQVCDLIEKVLKDDLNSERLKLLLAAYSHFYTARSLDALQYDAIYYSMVPEGMKHHGTENIQKDERLIVAGEIQSSITESSTTHYISALEVASLIYADKVEKCQTCQQDKYSISQRVQKFVLKYSASEVLANTIKSYYNLRSLYLHRGVEFRNNSYVGTSLPVLDLQSQSHTKEHCKVSLINLREWSSFLLRQILETNSLEKFENSVAY